MKNIIIISAHPDDETLGAGGTLMRHKYKGDRLFWIIITSIFERQGFSEKTILAREWEIEKVSNLYGFEKIFKFNYPTMELSSRDLISLVPKISEVFNLVKPNIIYSLNRSDAHSDHRVVFDATMACTKSFRYPFIEQILLYECLSETEFAPALAEKVFIPNYFVDISFFLQKKIDIMRIFSSELGSHPFPRSVKNIRALATYRGASAGIKYAEAFQLIKYIEKDAL